VCLPVFAGPLARAGPLSKAQVAQLPDQQRVEVGAVAEVAVVGSSAAANPPCAYPRHRRGQPGTPLLLPQALERGGKQGTKGNCVVCNVLAGKQVRGSREHVSVYKGQRYLFPGSKEREMFDADPQRFAAVAAKQAAGRDRRGAAKNEVAVVGRTACAGCAYGKRPLADPESLGIAVVAGDKVYIVERGEQLFPDIFASRFDGLKVKLAGSVKRSQGRFVWVDPEALTLAQ